MDTQLPSTLQPAEETLAITPRMGVWSRLVADLHFTGSLCVFRMARLLRMPPEHRDLDPLSVVHNRVDAPNMELDFLSLWTSGSRQLVDCIHPRSIHCMVDWILGELLESLRLSGPSLLCMDPVRSLPQRRSVGVERG